ncbi:hypothetical protein ACMS1Z_13610 [Acidiphilium multivorum]|uniref:hypothetical protein n=1 Tax=Acidiphilium multivorum TaxID=62140 RepID=UPI0039C968BB
MSMLALLAVVLAVGGLSNSSNSTSRHRTKSHAAAQQPEFVMIGHRGAMKYADMGCPTWRALNKFDGDYADAMAAKDKVGESNAITRALLTGCVVLNRGQTGLVIDAHGFLQSDTRIRLDENQVAYWTDTEAVGPAPKPAPN